MKGKCILLSRVSTESQDLVQQTNVVIQKCLSDGYDRSNIIIIEDKESGVKLSEEERLGLTELKATIESDLEVNCVYAYEISRIGRRAEVNYSIRNFLRSHKVQLRILNPVIELFDANFNIRESDNMLFAIFNSMAENEGYLRQQRCKRGKKAAAEKGQYLGGKPMLGYTTDRKTKKFLIDPDTSKIIIRIFNEYVEGKSCLEIGKQLMNEGYHKPSKEVYLKMWISEILRNECYNGKFPYPKLIDDELWNRCKEVRYNARIKPRNTFDSSTALCKGLIKDMSCHYTFTTSMHSNCYKSVIAKQQICLSITDEVVYREVCDYDKLVVNDPVSQLTQMSERIEQLKREVSTIGKNVDDLNAKKDKVWERNIEGLLSDEKAKQMSNKIEFDIRQLKDKLVANMREFDYVTSKLNDLTANNGAFTFSTRDYEALSVDDKKKLIKKSVNFINLEKITTYIWALHIHFLNGVEKTVKINTMNKKVLS